jgi:signal peptidase I
MNKGIWMWVRDVAIAVLIAIVIMQFVKPTVVQAHSMDDTLRENDYLFLSKQAYKLGGEPERGDIVVFRSALESGDEIIGKAVFRVFPISGFGFVD